MKKTIIISILLITSIFTSGYKKPDVYVIDAVRNAYIHNNKGLNYLKDNLYYPAIQEFKIAISLNPNTQATAVYYNNLGETYMKLGYPDMAIDCFEKMDLFCFSLQASGRYTANGMIYKLVSESVSLLPREEWEHVRLPTAEAMDIGRISIECGFSYLMEACRLITCKPDICAVCKD